MIQSPFLRYRGLPACALLLAALTASAQVNAPSPGDSRSTGEGGATTISIDGLSATGINQPISPDQTTVEVVYSLNGKETHLALPIAADTSLWKGSDTSQGSSTALTLRDNRYAEALVQLRVDTIPKDAEIIKADLRFRVGGVQNKGQAGTFACFRVLTPWTEDATWIKPSPEATAPWNGLQPGKDFDPAAFAQLAVPALDDKKPGGAVFTIPDFTEALKHWQDGSWPNHGFLLTLTGKALQLFIGSREGARNVKSFILGGPNDGMILLTPNGPLLSRVLLKPDDLLGAQIQVNVAKAAPAQLAGNLNVYAVKGDDTAPARRSLIGSFPLKNVPVKGPCTLIDVSEPLKASLRAGDAGTGLLLTSEGGAGAVELANNGAKPTLILKVRSYPSAQLFNVPIQPRDGVYTRVTNGHLTYGGQRLRLWGVVGYPDASRLVDMGFNAQRVWEPSAKVGPGKTYSVESAKRGEIETYVKGDGSQLDLADKHFADLKAHGMFVMFGAVSGSLPIDTLAEEGSFVSGGPDWVQWKEAIQTKGDSPNHYFYVDERLQKAKFQHAKSLLAHVNQYTGKAYGQEEAIAIDEVWNENGFLVGVLGGGLRKWPPYFKDKLQQRWDAWLIKQYTNEEGVRKAWGKLEAGESLAQGTVLPGPDFEDRLKFPEKRGDDFVHFMLDLQDDLHERFTAFCRAQAPAGIGVNVAPFSFDTMYRPSLQWAYAESRGNVMSMGMYFWDLKSQLDKPPNAYVMDSFTPAKTPVVLYETNVGRPDPYRSEYPLRLAALAATQDWDGVFWHYWGPVDGEGELPYLTGTLAPPVPSHYWMAVHHENDPVMCTTLALASRIFLGGYLPPAAAPETVKVGEKALYSYTSFRGLNVAPATFSTGSRLDFAPKDDSALTVGGAPMPVANRVGHAVASGKYVTWDWPNGRLIIDAPNVKAYVGRPNGLFRFSDGITFGKVNTPFVAFCMESADGKPLVGPQASKRILLGGVSDAKNSGFAFNYNVSGGPQEQAAAVTDRGHPPILVDKVEYAVWFPRQLDGVFKDYDFALRETRSQPIAKSNEISQHGPTPFMSVLEVSDWSAAEGTLPLAEATKIDTVNPVSPAATVSGGGASAQLRAADLAFPIPGMDWSMDYLTAHKFIENSPLVFTTFSPVDRTPNPAKTIILTDLLLPAFWNNTTDTNLTFQAEHLTGADVTLKAPPPVSEVIAQFTALLGEPVEKKLDAQYGTTRIAWKGKGKSPDLLVTESQGIMKLLYQAPK